MKTAEEKYRHDADFKRLVDTMEHYIHMAQFTPSELREAAIFASIRYMQYQTPAIFTIKPSLEQELIDANILSDTIYMEKVK